MKKFIFPLREYSVYNIEPKSGSMSIICIAVAFNFLHAIYLSYRYYDDYGILKSL